MRFGVHLSIQGGVSKMAKTAVELGCETVQIFSRSPRGGKPKPLDPDDIYQSNALLEEKDIRPLVIHAPYFVNLGSTEVNKRDYSIEVVAQELERAEALGAKFVVTHVGHKLKEEDDEAREALERVLDAISEVLSMYSGPVKLLLENSAGQGQEIGCTFDALGFLVKSFPDDKVGACFDTCHAFARGYDLSDAAGVESVLASFDDLVGLRRLEVVHLNDSKRELGSRVDRHFHIGQGYIGLEGFRAVISSKLLPEDMPGIMETPKDSDDADKMNLTTVKMLRDSG
ncbi:MAG TPA: deoxyribonuclease IV [Bacillota bacterium]|nr:deoxyribonuclease IV [Bacillota bacterium]HQD74362.1 deoxyribonuclease IV [Bacillota bacterium]